MAFWEELFRNEILISSVIAWTIAQVLKTIIDWWLNRRFLAERLVGSGGMPSSHSSIVCGLMVSTALVYGIGTFEFAICFVLSAVVMYDAIGVRRETGKQSKLLNLILEQNLFELNEDQFHEKLKEFVGHTPLQVFMGAVLGIATSFIVHRFY
ncbi:MAG: divergent PAP2 family protein [Clostridiales bacterium]|nr:divergent PAP2 family protein [Clostridiales bacterium]